MASDWPQINSAAAQQPQTCSQCHHDLYLQRKEERGVLEVMVCPPLPPLTDDRNIIDDLAYSHRRSAVSFPGSLEQPPRWDPSKSCVQALPRGIDAVSSVHSLCSQFTAFVHACPKRSHRTVLLLENTQKKNIKYIWPNVCLHMFTSQQIREKPCS